MGSSDSAPSSADQGRFIPGTVLAGRYRIIGLIGRGGMGEVYRADDLKLGQPVALKFLPVGLERDEGRLQRLLNEVRMALKVSHPNVCRVHDIGEVEGQHYISMEYVDGEDLSSLLRRIGRLPRNKAVQVARQLCAGLAAAHGQGVLHRDLKPANVMIDGRGQVKITDFGLAGVDDEISGADARTGTPAYMAPEQWAGEEVTAKSDLYALGLVLFELFTGERRIKGKTPAEIQSSRERASSVTPSSLVEGFDPAVERVILACLEDDPVQRPSSVMAVSAALPGGDPLAAALAAGETPSPELVAQAGGAEMIDTRTAAVLFIAFVLLTASWLALAPRVQITGYADLRDPPEVMVAEAREILSDVGYTDPPRDSLFDFSPNYEFIAHIGSNDTSPDRWERLRESQPSGLHFRYRQSPSPIAKVAGGSIGAWMEDPPLEVPGEAMVVLDLQGRLLSFLAVPPDHIDTTTDARADPDWDALLSAAGLDPGRLTEQEPAMVPPFYADRRIAWTGHYPDSPDTEIRVEAASFGGRPTAMRILEPWHRPTSEKEGDGFAKKGVYVVIREVTLNLMVLTAMIFAWRNLRLGRGDQKTALRFAVYLGVIRLFWSVGAHHVAAPDEALILVAHYAYSTWRVFLVLVFYLAIEPYARRLWPHVLVTWVRFFGGRWRDPVVGRDLLIGSTAGALLTLAVWFQGWLVPRLFGVPGPAPMLDLPTLEALKRGRHLVTSLAIGHTNAVLMTSLMMFLVLVVFRILFRRTWIAVGLVSLLSIGVFPVAYSSFPLHAITILIYAAAYFYLLFRFGFLALVVASSVSTMFATIPITADPSAWTFGGTLIAVAIALGVALYGLRAALAGRPVFTGELAATR
jgi:serine/threonine-protein kinase